MSKGKVSAEDKIYAVNLYLDGRKSQRQIAAAYGVRPPSVNQWIRNYQSMGADAFTLKGNKKYSKELKLQAVQDYLAGRGSQDDICKKYGIRAKAKLQSWIKKYNGHEELKSSGTGGSTIMTKGRKTTVYFGRKDQPSRSIRPPFTEKMITFHGRIDHLSRRDDHPQSFPL